MENYENIKSLNYTYMQYLEIYFLGDFFVAAHKITIHYNIAVLYSYNTLSIANIYNYI